MKTLFLLMTCLAILGLLTSCTPAAAPPPSAPTSRPGGEATQGRAAAPTPTATSATATPRYGGALTVGLKLVTPHFDMLQETSASLQIPLAPSYNLLIQHDPSNDFKVGPDLAKRWEVSPDTLSYVFSLNEGVRFHNGRPVTAEDVRFNFERIVNPPKGTLSPRKELYRNVSKIEAPDATTLKMTLKEPQASFLTLVALPYNFIFDPDVIKQKGDMKRDVMGTGPFKLQDYVQGVSMRLQKNAGYFIKGRPYLDGVTFYPILDEMTRSAAVRTRQVLLLPLSSAVSPALSLQMQKIEPTIVLQKKVTPSPICITPNSKVAPWNDVRVRQALSLAVDRTAASRVVRDFAPGYGYLLPGSSWELPEKELMAMPGNRQPKDEDLAEARRLLAEAGYPQGFESPMLSSMNVYDKETGEVAQAQLAKIGISLKIQSMESASWKQRIYEGAFRLASFPDASAVEDPDILLGEYYLTASPKNYGGWTSQKFDELYAAQSKAVDPEKRKQTVWEMQRLLHQEAPRVVVVWMTLYAASWREVQGWSQGTSNYLGNGLQDVWLTK